METAATRDFERQRHFVYLPVVSYKVRSLILTRKRGRRKRQERKKEMKKKIKNNSRIIEYKERTTPSKESEK